MNLEELIVKLENEIADGKVLLKRKSKQGNTYDKGVCRGYFEGVGSVLSELKKIKYI
jgi:hypothetical protein